LRANEARIFRIVASSRIGRRWRNSR